MKPGKILIRADASVPIGSGHVMRCLALAQAWQDAGGEAVFACAELPDALKSRLETTGISTAAIGATPGSLDDATATVNRARLLDASWIVVDGDRFQDNFLQHICDAGFRVLLLDDFADRNAFPADLIVNPNPGAEESRYSAKASSAQILTGLHYVLLRREFRDAGARVPGASGKKVLVTFGGSDPDDLTSRVVAALAPNRDLQITVVAGPEYANAARLQQFEAANVRVVIDSQDMARVILENDLAVIAAGGTLWEMLAIGCVPLSYARNAVQARVVQSLAKDGAVVDLGSAVAFSQENLATEIGRLAEDDLARENMASRGRKLIDSLGAARVVDAMLRPGAR